MPFSDSTQYALEGRVVTMNDAFDVLEWGVVYVAGREIVAVQEADRPPPDGFEHVQPIRTGGTIYPGLIELHNHLGYNVLPLWRVPQRFDNRSQWANNADYDRKVKKTMVLLATKPSLLGAIARYTECKCLLSGVTTTQGMRFKKKALEKYYDGLIRNVEAPDPATGLPAARTQVPDVRASGLLEFLDKLNNSTCYLLHLCEGVDPGTRRHFDVLQLPDGDWAINERLAGIHSVCLTLDDFRLMKERKAAVIWSPLSNLLLYGRTLDLRAVKESGVLLGIGSDWSPSGSKNLLSELKVARLVSQEQGDGAPVFSDQELLALATRNAARILKWEGRLGVLQRGALADMVVLAGRQGAVYEKFLTGRESAISLVIIDGVPRCGQKRLMQPFAFAEGELEAWPVGRAERLIYLDQVDPDPAVGRPSLRSARDQLQEALRTLPALAAALAQPQALESLAEMAEEQWFLVLDIDEHDDAASPLEALFSPSPLESNIPALMAALPGPDEVDPAELDAPTVADDRNYFPRLAAQDNLPEFIKAGLPALY